MLTMLLIATMLSVLPIKAAFKGTIKIGVIGPVGLPHWDPAGMKPASEMAADEINAAGGVHLADGDYQIVLAFGDEHAYPTPDPAAAASEVERLITVEGCEFLIGGFRSEVTGAMIEKAMDYKTPFFINGASTTEFISTTVNKSDPTKYERYKYLFRVNPVNSTMLLRTVADSCQYLLATKLLPLFGHQMASVPSSATKNYPQTNADPLPQNVPPTNVNPIVRGPQNVGVPGYTGGNVSFPEEYAKALAVESITKPGATYWETKTDWNATSSKGNWKVYLGNTLFTLNNLELDKTPDVDSWNYYEYEYGNPTITIQVWIFANGNCPNDYDWLKSCNDNTGFGYNAIPGQDTFDDRGFLVRKNFDNTTDVHWLPGDPEPGDQGFVWAKYYGVFASSGFDNSAFAIGHLPFSVNDDNQIYELAVRSAIPGQDGFPNCTIITWEIYDINSDHYKPVPVYDGSLHIGPYTQVKVAVLLEDLPWTQIMYTYLTDPAIYPYVLGPYANVTYRGRIPDGTTDCTPWLQDIEVSDPPHLLIEMFSGTTSPALTVQLRAMNVSVMVVGIDVLGQLQAYWNMTQAACEYEATLVTGTGTRTPVVPGVTDVFWDKFVSKTGTWPMSTAIGAYNGIKILAEALGAIGNKDKDALVAYYENPAYDTLTLTGKFKFDSSHDVYCSEVGPYWTQGYVRPFMVQWQAGRMEVVYPVDQVYSKKWAIPPWMYPLKADANFDGKVNIADVFTVAKAFGTQPGHTRWEKDADMNFDNQINISDIFIIATAFGRSITLPLP